jgi:hypothetical protein
MPVAQTQHCADTVLQILLYCSIVCGCPVACCLCAVTES